MKNWKLFRGRALYLAATLFATSLLLPGCGAPEPPPDGQLQIENVAKWYSLYRAENRGKPPADEAAFVKFVNEQLSDRGETVDAAALAADPFVYVDGTNGTGNYALWSNLTASTLNIEMISDTDRMAISGIQIVERVPEPSSALLMSLAGLGLLVRRRK